MELGDRKWGGNAWIALTSTLGGILAALLDGCLRGRHSDYDKILNGSAAREVSEGLNCACMF